MVRIWQRSLAGVEAHLDYPEGSLPLRIHHGKQYSPMCFQEIDRDNKVVHARKVDLSIRTPSVSGRHYPPSSRASQVRRRILTAFSPNPTMR